MSAQMKDNPLNAEGKSSRRKIIDEFEINPRSLHPLRHLRRCLQFRRHRDEPRARAEQVRAQRQPSRSASPARNGQDLPGIDRLEAQAARKEQRSPRARRPKPKSKAGPIELAQVSRAAVEHRKARMLARGRSPGRISRSRAGRQAHTTRDRRKLDNPVTGCCSMEPERSHSEALSSSL